MTPIEHSEITVEKIVRNVWVAKVTITKPYNMEVTMKGNSEANAKDKLKSFLNEAK